jgi:hypothetical protein
MPTSIYSHVEPDPRRITELCEFCLELVQVISSPDEDQYWKPLVQPICSACEFCEELTERLTSAALPRKYTPDTAEPPHIIFTRGVLKNEVDLRCEITILHEATWLSFAVWANEGV